MTKVRLLLPCFALCAGLCAVTPTFAQTAPSGPVHDPRIGQLIDSLNQVKTVRETALSPDGKYIVWNVGGRGGSDLELAPLDNPSAARRITACEGGGRGANRGQESNAVFSPDSRQIAFFSDCNADHKMAVFLTDASGLADASGVSAPHQLAGLNGFAKEMQWSPDGKRLSFLYVEGATRPSGALAAEKPPSGVIGVEGLEVQRVATVDAASGQLTQITPAKLHVFEFDWSPDSTKLAYVAAPPPGENNWWVAKLYTEPVIERIEFGGQNGRRSVVGGAAQPILDPPTVAGPLHGLQIAVPRWSQDGQQIAFIGGLMSDQGSTGGDIYVMPATGGEPKDVTPNRAASPAFFVWLDDKQMGVAEIKGGSSHLFVYNIATHEDSTEYNLTLPGSVGAGGMMMSVATSNTNNIALIRSSFDSAPEVWAGELMSLKQITHINDAAKPLWGKSESVEWDNEGFHVQGWLLLPGHYDPAKKYPLIVEVHGGPSSAVVPRWPGVGYGPVPFSALDYFVLMPNPRGSYGEGEKFTQANRKDFGYGDLRDILAGVDTVEKKYRIDDGRVGLTGWSYGGFMTMFAVTQTHRFKAAVAGAGISNWQSYYGENSIDQWMIPFFGASVYDDPAVYAKMSAINFIKNVKTPTLSVVGDRDGECPAPQSFEFWHALRDLGEPTELVVYPDEGHGFVNPEHRRDVLERALGWFEEYMP
jgi:dipeptidyl aminopeptidase/acylaminoacyl peptidase